MKVRKLAFTLFVLVLAFAVIAASNQATLTYGIKKGETKSFTHGRAGVTFTNSQLDGSVIMQRFGDSARVLGTGKPEFKQELLDVRFADTSNQRVTHVLGAVYVYFLVRRSEVKLYEKGQLAIYWLDTWKQNWVKCDTYAVVDDGATTALGCRIRVFGLYGLAYTE